MNAECYFCYSSKHIEESLSDMLLFQVCVCVHVTCKLGGVAGLCPDTYCDYCDEIASQMSQIVCFKFMELSELSSMFQTSLQSHKHN